MILKIHFDMFTILKHFTFWQTAFYVDCRQIPGYNFITFDYIKLVSSFISGFNFLTKECKKEDINKTPQLDIKSYIKPTKNYQYLHRKSSHNPAVFKSFIKKECV